MSDAQITLECVGCKARRLFVDGECGPSDCPMCAKCMMPMVVVKAKVTMAKRPPDATGGKHD